MINQLNTHWVFVCGMNSEKDDQLRHVTDIFFALSVLKRKGISHNNISVLIDPSPHHLLSYLPDDLPFDGIKISPVQDLKQIIHSRSLENLVLTVLGHGSPQGIDADSLLKPHDLINIIHSKKDIKNCAVIFGQCYSGIYNYINLIKECGSDESKPVICFIGASGLNSSLSSSVSIELYSKPLNWVANIFLCYFFVWIENNEIHRDIDGDNKETLADAYKYAGANTSQHLLQTKANIALALYPIQQALSDKTKLVDESSPDYLDQLVDIDGLRTRIKNFASINHTVQDPWILNANKARNIIFDL